MPVVWIPALLRSLTAGQDRVVATGNALADLIADLDSRHPGLRERLCEGRNLRPGLAVVIDGDVARLGLDQPVANAKEVHFVHAIGGGSAAPCQSPLAPDAIHRQIHPLEGRPNLLEKA